MSISASLSRKEYTGDAATVDFDFPYRFLDSDDLIALVDGVSVSIASVSGEGAGGGGTVTLSSPPADLAEVVILYDPARTQTRDFVSGEDLPAEAFEDGLDKLTVGLQRQADRISRAFAFGDGVQLGAFTPTFAAAPTAGDMAIVADDGLSLDWISGIDTATVAALADEIAALGGITASISAVAAIDTEVAQVAGVASSVAALGPLAASLSTLAGISANVTTVAGIAADVTTVAGIAGNVTSVAGIAANVTTVAGLSADLSTLAGLDTELAALGAIAAAISGVNAIAANVTTVAGIAANVTTVAGVTADLASVAAIAADVGVVAALDTDVTAVADIAANVTTVAGIAGNVTTVAGIASDVAIVAALGVLGILSGSGAPAGGLGINGNFYIDTAATALYGPKAGGVWGSAVSLIGPSGPGTGDLVAANALSELIGSAATARANIGALAAGGDTMSGLLTLSGDPSSALHAASKQYVDNTAAGLDVKASVRVATTANITLSGAQTIDGVAVIAGDRVLVKNQSTTANNGIYVCAAGAWARASDMDAWAEVPGAMTLVEEGTANADSGWVCSSNAGGTLNTTAIAFSQFFGTGLFQPANSNLTTWAGVAPSANGQSLVASASYATMRALLDVEPGVDYLAYSGFSANGITLVGQTFANMRSSLGLVIGTNVQAYSTVLAGLAASAISGTVTVSTSAPSGGTDGDIWLERAA